MAGKVISTRNTFVLLIVYFAAQLLVRLAISDSADLDQAEQLVLTQGLRWGYGSQPPLYTWLQAGVIGIFGLNIFSLCLLKNLLLFGTCLFIFLSAKETTGDDRPAVAAMSSLFLIPQFAWESQRDLTHSVLVTMCAAATLFVFLRLLRTRRTGYYALFGLCAGLGLLAKYNFALFLVALALAALSLTAVRPVLISRRIFLSLALLLAVVLAHVLWMATHADASLTQLHKLHLQDLPNSFNAYCSGLQSLISAVAAFAALLVATYAVLFYGSPPVTPAVTGAVGDYRRLIQRAIIAGLLLCVATVFCFKAYFTDRWLQPLLFMAPIGLILQVLHKLDGGRFARLLLLNRLAAVIVLVALPLAPLLASVTGFHTRMNAPFSALADGIKARGFEGGVIAAENRLIAGNLKLFSRTTRCCRRTSPRSPPRGTALGSSLGMPLEPTRRRRRFLILLRGCGRCRLPAPRPVTWRPHLNTPRIRKCGSGSSSSIRRRRRARHLHHNPLASGGPVGLAASRQLTLSAILYRNIRFCIQRTASKS